MEFFICNLVRVVQSPRFYMSLFLTLLCMSLEISLLSMVFIKLKVYRFFLLLLLEDFHRLAIVVALLSVLIAPILVR